MKVAMARGYTLAMDATNKFDGKKFYAQKAARLATLNKALQDAIDELWVLHVAEERAPAGDPEEIATIFDKVTEAHKETNALLAAVKAMLP